MKSFTSFILCGTLALCTIIGVMIWFCPYAVGVMTNEPCEYIIQSRYGGAYQNFSCSKFFSSGIPQIGNDPLKHYNLHTAPRFSAKQIKDAIAPKDYKTYEKNNLFFRIRKIGDEYHLKEVTLEEMN